MALTFTYILGFSPDSGARREHWECCQRVYTSWGQAREVATELSLAANSAVFLIQCHGQSENLVEIVSA
jgi:hypothetical protein